VRQKKRQVARDLFTAISNSAGLSLMWQLIWQGM
jgi:hypothetical protein